MKNVRIVFIGGLLCLASVCHHGFAVYADDTSLAIRTRVDKNVIQIGDTVNYEIIVSADKRIEIEMPVGQKALGEFEIKDVRTSVKTVWGKKTIRQRYLLQAFSAGSWPLSAGAIKFKRSDTQVWHLQEVPQQTIEVTSVLTQQGQAAAMRDIKGPLGVVSWGLLLAAVFLLVAAILGLVIFLKNKKARLKQEPKRLAHEIALEQLAALKQQDLIRQGKIQEYFVVISDIIRHYIEQRFALRAPEMTTEEFLGFARDFGKFEESHTVLLKEFLTCCDLVKFARHAPTTKEIEAVYESAGRFIQQTKEEIAPATSLHR